jgi:molybdopterin-guanine dinucleotide biosynthesis protein A
MTQPRFEDVTAALLAGGKAARMGGAAKGLLVVGGSSILDRQLAVLRPRCAEVLAVLAAGEDLAAGEAARPFRQRGLRTLADHHADRGPLAGVHAALLGSRTEWILAVAWDMPFLDGDVLDQLAARAVADPDAEAVVPVAAGRPEPLHALYRRPAAEAAARCLREGRRAMTDLLDAIRTRFLDEAALPSLAGTRSFANVNTLEEAARAGAGRTD